MRILPPALAPWPATIDRRHSPPRRRSRNGYRTYRSCLRWEFGFTCAFCLCHEADLVPRGAEGLGVTQVEHFVPVSHDESGAHVYSNCFYVCRFCNRARGATPNVDPAENRRLLNPCADVWAEHFQAAGDAIEAREGSADGAYTRDVYQLNDPRKVVRRRHRRETLEECLAFLERAPAIVDRLLEEAAAKHDPRRVDEARAIEDAMRRAWRDLQTFEAVPQDAPKYCACGGVE